MRAGVVEGAPPLARWTSRIALFALALVAATAFLHRLFSMPTPVALNLMKLAFALAGLGLALAIVAGVRIWRFGGPGAPRVVFGSVLTLALLASPLALIPTLQKYPELNDVTTDLAAPPVYAALAKARPMGANSVTYPAQRFAKLQAEAYPDLKTLVVDRSGEETFEIVAEAMRRQRMTIVNEAPAAAPGKPGILEATDKTLIAGFTDDVVARIEGDDKRSKIDLRSSSRYGRHDLGRNAERLRRLFKEIVGRLEATVPTASGERMVRLRSKLDRAVPKRLLKARDPGKVAPRATAGPSPAGAQRAPAPKASPPGSGDRPARDRRPAQSSE